MLMPVETLAEPPRNPRRERSLWHDESRHSLSLGCTICPDRNLCGGLRVGMGLFNCLGFCCENPADCDAVCRNNPREFARRVWEVGGFSLNNVARAPVLAAPKLPKLVPTIFHGNKHRCAPLQTSPAVCLPFYKIISRHNGSTRYANQLEMAADFGILPTTSVILTGTAADPPLERWWSLGPQRRDAIRALCDLGIALVTTPNFSLFTDQPRWDDLHSMKRIALVHEEFLREGLPAALHVNARSERDWERWREYLVQRPEVTHIAFEFATGAGRAGRMSWHVDQIIELCSSVGRPLHLVLRGGVEVLPELVKTFSDITVLETSTFLKTVNRQRARLTAEGKVSWSLSPTAANDMFDDLFTENWQIVTASYASLLGDSVTRSGRLDDYTKYPAHVQ